jgi:HSP20 family molecular chaperone IbpA
MKLYLSLLAALASMASARAWMLGPMRRSLLATPSLLDTSLMWPSQLLRESEELMNSFDRSFSRTSPRYEITNNNEQLKIAIDVPGVKAQDIHVTLEEDGQVLSITGHREVEKEGYKYASRFAQSFTLDPSVDIDKFSADLSSGVLVITAPKDMKRLEQSVRKIPVMQSAEDKAAQEAAETMTTAETAVEHVEEEKKEEKHEKIPVEMK